MERKVDATRCIRCLSAYSEHAQPGGPWGTMGNGAKCSQGHDLVIMALTCAFCLVAGAGFEPATSGL